MKLSVAHIRDWYSRSERSVSSLALFGGFIIDILTLKRVDTFWENFLISLHLVVVATCIILVNLRETDNIPDAQQTKSHFWFINIIQFSFGGLLSAFLVFYFRSATLAVSWPFILLLILAFLANESLKKQHERLIFQISLFYLSLLSFSIFIIPVLFNQISVGIFLISGLVSLLIIWLFTLILKFFARERFLSSKKSLIVSITSIFFLVNILYFFNLIPPIPLALKDAGVYHSVYKNESGNYVVLAEKKSWQDYFKPREVFHKSPSDSIYVFSAIFSPTAFHTSIIHEWQRYDQKEGWQTINKIRLSASGGRAEGYRTYSTKADISTGKWRVNIKTLGGQTIGRLRFDVALASSALILESQIK